MEALLGVGRAPDAATAAEHLLVGEPLRESLHALRLLALYRSSRQTDALTAFQALRDQLSEDVGVDPGPALRRLHAQLLQQDPTLDWSPPRTAAVVEGVPAVHLEQRERPDRRADTRSWGATPRSTSSSRPYVAARRATVRSGWCRARPGSGRPGWRRRSPRGLVPPAPWWPSAGPTRRATARPTGPWAQVLRACRASRVTVPGWCGDGHCWDGRGVQPHPGGAARRGGGPPRRPGTPGRLPAGRARGPPLGRRGRACCSCRRWPGWSATPRSCCCAPTAWRTQRQLERSDRCSPGSRGRRPPNASACPATRGGVAGPARRTSRLAARRGPGCRAAARTGGNPFYLQELARLVRDSAHPHLAWDDIPETVHDVLTHRLSRLPV